MKRKTIIEIISSLLIFLFVYTAFSKLIDTAAFKRALADSPFSSYSNSAVAALALPIAEGLVALALFFPRTRLAGLWGSLVLLSAFTASMIFLTKPLVCPCGGLLKQMTWNQHLVFNGFFLLLALAGIVLLRKQTRKQLELSQPPPVVFT